MNNLFKFSIVFLLITSVKLNFTFAQIYEPVQWETSVIYLANNEAELLFKANIEDKWHIFAQSSNPKASMPLNISFEKNKNYEIIGKLKEPKPIEEFDDVFQLTVSYFTKEVTFKQKIKILSPKPFIITGTIDYQSCIEGMCVPGTFNFQIKVKIPDKILVENIDTQSVDNAFIDTVKKISNDSLIHNYAASTLNSSNINNIKGMSLWKLFLFAFITGLAAILTPCVFPMIPMTVSFFMHDSNAPKKSRLQATFFGISIILIYTVVGTLVALTLGVNFANWLSTHWLPNILFFLIFLIFACSFLGMFEITLPGWLINKSDKQSDKGGIFAPFFMAFTLVLVSFSCTGPLVGSILNRNVGLLYSTVNTFHFFCLFPVFIK